MPVGFADFDASVKLQRACQQLQLDRAGCNLLQGLIVDICGAPKSRKTKTKRARSRWQECIATRRKGKKFDPQAIKDLAKEYRAGTCP